MKMEKKNWTADEVEYLRDAWGRISLPGIAARLGRSVIAVKQKAVRLQLGSHLHNSDDVTLCSFAKELGYSYQIVRYIWPKYGFKVRYRKVIDKKYATVSIADFWNFAQTHRCIVKIHFDEGLLGEEPSWVAQARIYDLAARRQIKTTPWTGAEDGKLKALLLRYDMTYSEIADELHRTEQAVNRRISTLNLPYRPFRRESRCWTAEEEKSLMIQRRDGRTWEDIGRRLGRSALSCQGKYERLINPEYRPVSEDPFI